MNTTQPPGTLRCRVIEHPDEWESLHPSWDGLLRDTPGSTPWQSWDFLARWWRHLSKAHRLRIFVVERDGSPCLILPLQISTWPWLPAVPVHILEPIGMIMDVNRPRLALGRNDPAAYACALEEIWRRRPEWHLIRLEEKTADDDELPLLQRFARTHDLLFRQAYSHPCPYLDLRQDWQSYLKSRGSRLRKNLAAARRRLEALGQVTLRSYETAGEIAAGFEILLQLHQRSWKPKKKVEYGGSAAYRDFYGDWLQSQTPAKRARILALFCDDRPVAATVACMDDSTYYSAQIVHDAEFDRCSPGTLLESLELEGLMKEQRFANYDFLGGFLSNKMRWTDTALSTAHVFVMRRCLRNALIDTYYFRLKPRLKPTLLRLLKRVGG